MRHKGGKLRWLVTIAAAGSVGLLVFSSLWHTLLFNGDTGGRPSLGLSLWGGTVSVGLDQFHWPFRSKRHCIWQPRAPGLTNGWFDLRKGRTLVQIPVVWVALPLTVAASSMWFVHIRRRGRMIGGACPACGYDLSGTPGAVCPECGEAAGGGAGA